MSQVELFALPLTDERMSNIEFLGIAGKDAPKIEPPPVNGRTRYFVKAEDIKHPNRLSDDQIADIPVEHVYAWVKSGLWKQKDFKRWLKVLRVIE